MTHIVYLTLNLLYLIFLEDFCEASPCVIMHLCKFLYQSSSQEQTVFRPLCEMNEGLLGRKSRQGYLKYFLGYSYRPFQFSLTITVFFFFDPRWIRLMPVLTEKIRLLERVRFYPLPGI